MTTANLESEISLWLEVILKKENVNNISVRVQGNSEKGDGYMGDIIFVHVSGSSEDNCIKNYDLVLKCSKRSQSLRNSVPIKEVFLKEIYIYEKLLPAFTQFQLNKGIKDVFDSVPKCYGHFTSDEMEVIAFENLKKIGYDLWDKKKPLARKYIDMVAKEYGKFHSVSVAMQNQQPEEFKKHLDALEAIFNKYKQNSLSNTHDLFKNPIEEVCDLLKNQVEERTISQFRKFKDKISDTFNNLFGNYNTQGLNVILHGDCWNNNFMYYCDNNKTLKKVAILDWQVSRFGSPIVDLSYFLFACISEEDLKHLDTILETYYTAFASNLRRLGSDPDKLYPYQTFMEDWKQNCKFGIGMCPLIFKVCSTEKDEVVDIAEGADKGKDMSQTFTYEIKNTTLFMNRAKPIVKYVVEHELI